MVRWVPQVPTRFNGRASSTLTLGSSVGTNTVSVSAAGIQGVETFTAEAQSSPPPPPPPPPTATTLVKISGDNQQGVINTALGNPFVVEVRDQNGSVLSGIEVTFSVTGGGGTLGTTNTTTRCEWEGIEYPYPWVKRGNKHGLCVCRWDSGGGDLYRRSSVVTATTATAAAPNSNDIG